MIGTDEHTAVKTVGAYVYLRRYCQDAVLKVHVVVNALNYVFHIAHV